MASSPSHLSFSLALAAVYSTIGISHFGVAPEHALLAAVLIVVAGMLPNVDQSTSSTAKEMAGLLAAVSPLVALQLFPVLNRGGVPRLVLAIVVCYLATRLVVMKILGNFTHSRGMFHSIPAAIISGELAYLLFWDLSIGMKAYLGFAAFSGFMLHLIMDGYGNLNIVGKAIGREREGTPSLKLLGDSTGMNIAVYCLMFFLSWCVAQDFYPNLGVYGGVTY